MQADILFPEQPRMIALTTATYRLIFNLKECMANYTKATLNKLSIVQNRPYWFQTHSLVLSQL